MSDLREAIALIRKYEGFSEKAFPSGDDGSFTIGHGTQYYPDGSPVKQGQWCTKEKALDYLCHETEAIENSLSQINIHLTGSAKQGLISFIHSIGWKPFLYSTIIDSLNNDEWGCIAEEMTHWIFDEYHCVIGGLIDRRREEMEMVLREVNDKPRHSTEVLMMAFRNYTAAVHQIRAIRQLEDSINPYLLAEFANSFEMDEDPWRMQETEEVESFSVL